MYTSYCERGKHFFLAESWGETVCEGHKDEDSCGSVDLDREDESSGSNSIRKIGSATPKGTGASAPVPRGAAGQGDLSRQKKAQPRGQAGQIQQLILGF